MATQDKIIAGVLLLHSSLGVLWTYWVASHAGFPSTFLVTNLVLAALGVAAGIAWLRRHRWAGYLALAFFLVQLVLVLTPTFQWSFTLGFNLNIGLGWFGSGEVGLNLFAAGMLIWIGTRAFAPNKSFKPNSLRESA